MFRVKICGITRAEDLQAAAAAGADAVGLNFYAASPRAVSPERARELAAAAPVGLVGSGVFVDTPVTEIRRLLRHTPLDAVQLHGDYPAEEIASLADLPVVLALRDSAPGFPAAHKLLAECRAAGARFAALLLDAHAPGRYGGTGLTVDWPAVAASRSAFGPEPLILAGGLTPANVAEALRASTCDGVDTAGGVESSPGVKDHAKVRAFVEAARGKLESKE